MKLIRYLLLPVVPLYYLVTALRNTLYNVGIFKSRSYDFPILCVGNLSVGGTGKTPMVEYLLNLLMQSQNVATLSRGYKRETAGFVLADASATAASIGDEPFQFYSKFKDEIHVAVDTNRQRGITLLKKHANPDVIILDDAFQHRSVRAGLTILLTVYDDLYTDDWLLPTGNLRESVSGAKRADIIVVTKCPEELSNEEKNAIQLKLKIASHQHLFFSTIYYSDKAIGSTKTLELASLREKEFTLITGIANPKPLVSFLEKKQLNFKHIAFPDHHTFTADEVEQLQLKGFLLTTEKDYMRLQQYEVLSEKLFYLPIRFRVFDEALFNRQITAFVST